MEQPSDGQTTQSRKQCWGCGIEWIPYDFGYCPECWNRLSDVEQQVYQLQAWCSPTVGSGIRVALSNRIKELLRERRPYTPLPRQEKVRRRVLPEINLELGDLDI